jgi:exosome complex component RRP42
MILSNKEHILKSLSANIRFDGRKKDEFRHVSIIRDVSRSAEGSAIVHFGKTSVIAGVKLSLGVPYPDTPDEGMLMVDVQLLPLSNPEYENGPPDITAIEVSRIVDRGIRESKAIDVKRLCIEHGKRAWSVNVDICTLNADGNVYDACALAALVALSQTRLPAIDPITQTINYQEKTNEFLELTCKPVAVTLYKIQDQIFVDPTSQEENLLDSRLTITVKEDGTICSMQKGGAGTLRFDEIDHMIELALKHAQTLRKNI